MSERSYTEGELTQWLETTGDHAAPRLRRKPAHADRPLTPAIRVALPRKVASDGSHGPRADDHGAAGSVPADRTRCAPRPRGGYWCGVVRRLAAASAGPIRPGDQWADRVRGTDRPVVDGQERLSASHGRHHDGGPHRPARRRRSSAAQPSTATRSSHWTALASLSSAKPISTRCSTSWRHQEATLGP